MLQEDDVQAVERLNEAYRVIIEQLSRVIVGQQQVIEELLEFGVNLEQINVGGIHFKEGRTKYLSYLYLSSEEVSSFSRLLLKGVSMSCQDVPDAKKVSLKYLISQKH